MGRKGLVLAVALVAAIAAVGMTVFTNDFGKESPGQTPATQLTGGSIENGPLNLAPPRPEFLGGSVENRSTPDAKPALTGGSIENHRTPDSTPKPTGGSIENHRIGNDNADVQLMGGTVGDG